MRGSIKSAMALASQGATRAAKKARKTDPEIMGKIEAVLKTVAMNQQVYNADDINMAYEKTHGKELTHTERLGSAGIYTRLQRSGFHTNVDVVVEDKLLANQFITARQLVVLRRGYNRSTIVRANGKQRHGTLTTVWYSSVFAPAQEAR